MTTNLHRDTVPYKHHPRMRSAHARRLHDLIAVYEDWPKLGVTFRDVMPACADRAMFDDITSALLYAHADEEITHVVGVESRGLIFGAALAQVLGVGFVAARKAKPRPWKTATVQYQLEYGMDGLELPEGALDSSCHVIVVDDLMALGGTAEAAVRLCHGQGAKVVSVDVVVELEALGGRARLAGVPVNALLTY